MKVATGFLTGAVMVLTIAVGALWLEIQDLRTITEEPYLPYTELSIDTPVDGSWRTTEGETLGTYTTTLGDLNNVSAQITELTVFKAEVSALINETLTDPEKRGILLRHDFTQEQLDVLAEHFPNELGDADSLMTSD